MLKITASFSILQLIIIGVVAEYSQNNEFGISESQNEVDTEPQVHRHVSVHVAPEYGSEETRVIRVPGARNRHVNIVFVKVPSAQSSQKTEVVLPETPQHRNIVYILTKKPSQNGNIKITKPQRMYSAPKPQVFFIQYDNNNNAINFKDLGPQEPIGNIFRSNGISTSTVVSGYGAPL